MSLSLKWMGGLRGMTMSGDDLIKKGMRVELRYLYSSSAGNRKPDIVPKDASGVVWVLDWQILSDWVLPTETKLKNIRATPVWWTI